MNKVLRTIDPLLSNVRNTRTQQQNRCCKRMWVRAMSTAKQQLSKHVPTKTQNTEYPLLGNGCVFCVVLLKVIRV
jgi:hypothetical protein